MNSISQYTSGNTHRLAPPLGIMPLPCVALSGGKERLLNYYYGCNGLLHFTLLNKAGHTLECERNKINLTDNRNNLITTRLNS